MAWPRTEADAPMTWRDVVARAMRPADRQQPFALVSPLLRSALLLGVGAGFALASVLSVSLGFHLPLGAWWLATAQAHGRIQVFGWAGLFVLGVAFHFLPRLRGAPLRWPEMVRWLLGAEVAGLLLRGLAQPLLTLAPDSLFWGIALIVSAALEVIGLGLAVTLMAGTALRPGAPKLRSKVALWGVWPFLICVALSLTLAPLVNLVGAIQAAQPISGGGIVPPLTDDASVLLGLFGFLTPMALAMSARALPLYAGLESIPQRILWPIACGYGAGLALALIGDAGQGAELARLHGAGLALLGAALICFLVIVTRLMTRRGRLPAQVRKLAPTPEQVARNYTRHISDERARYGPYVALIISAYLWAFLAGALLVVDGVAIALNASPPVTLDAARHSIAVGFIALLLAGVSVRMIPGFSGGHIRSPRLVTTMLWLGNAAALLRVGSLLAQPLLDGASAGAALDSALFGISGPLGLTFALILAITLWPALARSTPPAGEEAGG
ncbi:MAG TPA: NnrS family protein [Ktedonobacterales bacterium]|nr:NnrS family protein [Ktedonobacterales bacterium]